EAGTTDDACNLSNPAPGTYTIVVEGYDDSEFVLTASVEGRPEEPPPSPISVEERMVLIANTFSFDELIDRVGCAHSPARALVQARENGPFTTIASIDAVYGVGRGTMAS